MAALLSRDDGAFESCQLCGYEQGLLDELCERSKTTSTKLEQRSWIKIDVTRGRSAQECFRGLREACADTALPYRTVARWVKAFREGRDAVQDNLRTERPRVEDNTVQLLASLLDADRRWTVCVLAAEVGVYHKTVLHILQDILGSSRPKKVRPTQSAVNVMFIVVYDIDGVILHHAVSPRQTANADYCCRFLQHHLRPLAPLAMGDSGTPIVLTRLSPCDYDLFTKVKEPLRGTRCNIRDEFIHAIGRSIRNINEDGRADGVRRLPNIWQKSLRWAGHVACMGESRNAYRVLVGRPEGNRSLGRPRRRWEDNIKMDLREVGCDGRDWINLAQDRDRWRAYVRAAMNLRILHTIHCNIYDGTGLRTHLKVLLTPPTHTVLPPYHAPKPASETVLLRMLEWNSVPQVSSGKQTLKTRYSHTVKHSTVMAIHAYVRLLVENLMHYFHIRLHHSMEKKYVIRDYPTLPDLSYNPLPYSIGFVFVIRLRWAGHLALMGEFRNTYRVLGGRPEGKRRLGRPRLRWEDNIKMDLREMGHDNRDWINLAQDRDRLWAYVRAAMNLRVP
ncbi:hypothetical protein ANN_14159 [Periplaneta americana]|uniref:Mos1 transposase HTH domain-containing protein n=1 Tax=Periplaneta americana TaxID=6978 RepID=A0ABQ8SVJ0_PERAM|nr:hypothetical protein ANN_14159 [Periplaneta americana]